VQQQKVGRADHVLPRNRAAAIAGADQQPATVARDALDPFDQFVNPLGTQDGVIVTHVALVVDLDQHVAISFCQNPVDGVVHAADHGRLVLQAFVLAKVVDPQDDRHSQRVRRVEYLFEPMHVVRPQAAVGG
jgi:hypothetical protein